MCSCKGFPRDWPEPPGRRGGEGTGEVWLQPPRKDSLYSTRPKSGHLGDGRPHDSGAGEMRPGTMPCVPAAEIRSPECRLKTWSEGLKPGSPLLTHARQVRPRRGRGRGPSLAPPLEAAYPSGAWPPGRTALVGERSARAPPPAYKSGAALQLAQFSPRPVTRTLRETHSPDSPW